MSPAIHKVSSFNYVKLSPTEKWEIILVGIVLRMSLLSKVGYLFSCCYLYNAPMFQPDCYSVTFCNGRLNFINSAVVLFLFSSEYYWIFIDFFSLLWLTIGDSNNTYVHVICNIDRQSCWLCEYVGIVMIRKKG